MELPTGGAGQRRSARPGRWQLPCGTSMPGKAAWVYCTLGNAYWSQGDYAKAIAYHTQHLAMAKEVGDRAGEGKAYANLGNAYRSQGDFSKAIAYHTQHLAIAKELGDRAGEGRAHGNLGPHALERVRQICRLLRSTTRLGNIADACTRAVRRSAHHGCRPHPSRPGISSGPCYWRLPHSHSSASACLNDRVLEAAKWLHAALDDGHEFANLHLAHLTFRCGPRGRGAGASERAPLVACAAGTLRLRRVWANTGRGYANAHVQRLPCSEVLQRRSPKDGFDESRTGRESDDGAAQGCLRSTQRVARGC
jgi:tetratricopeptide (TPR) repeat protein